MDIREAIIHARQVAEGCGVDSRDCAYQHDYLADWLEELQAYRAKIPFDRLDEAAALVKARDEGRAVVLPCKVGDGIYSLSWNVKTEQYDVRSGEVKNVRYDSAGDTVTVSDGEYFRVLGKTVFLTRAEAEAALGGGEDG